MRSLFLFSHPDDEAFGPAGTISHLSQSSEVIVVSLCKGDRPGNEHVLHGRQRAFEQCCKLLGATPVIFNSSDLHLDYHQALKDIESILKEFKPSKVFTHTMSDVHIDHTTTGKAVLAACRPTATSTVEELYMCEIPPSTYWSFGQTEPAFIPNVYMDISNSFEKKKQALSFYESELYKYPDSRSVEGMEALARYRGSQVGFQYAEAFNLVYSLNRLSIDNRSSL